MEIEMKALMMTLGIAMIVASPAMAQTGKRQQVRPAAQIVSNGPQVVDSQAVVLDDQYIARDPDAQVRLELQRSGAFYQHGGY
jgi:hypothetical protein